MMGEDKILLKLHRQYAKDEAMKVWLQEISSLKFRLGELQSENAELKYELSKPKEETKTAKEWKRDDFFAELKLQLHNTMISKRAARKDMETWQQKYFRLIGEISLKAPELLKSIQNHDNIT
jgi:hypothetical protein